MIEETGDARGMAEAPPNVSGLSRARRLFAGWSANLFLMVLGLTQQVALVPVFLLFWSSDVLAAWLVLYAVGNLVLIADSGLQFRAINRFLAFKSSADCDGRTARFYAAMLRIYQDLQGRSSSCCWPGRSLPRRPPCWDFSLFPALTRPLS